MKSDIKTITRKLSISLTLIGGAAFAPQALADEGYALAFNPAQIRSEADMQRLHARIVDVAKVQCPTSKGVRSIRLTKSCRNDVAADLVRKVGQPEFGAFVERQSQPIAPTQVAANN